LTSQIISKGFTGRHGRAYLVQGTPSHIHQHDASLPNTYQNKAVPRNLVTGQHTVSDISCAICGSVLGWKYVEASEESQKYKVGKYILETKRIRIGVTWENDGTGIQGNNSFDEIVPLPYQQLRSLHDGPSKTHGTFEVEFDSNDEDECEDLFAGVWSPALAAKRKQRKKGRMSRKEALERSMARSSSADTLS
jgi:Yippee zinc-binding/DNA-binding /Mis18, centromere assembly